LPPATVPHRLRDRLKDGAVFHDARGTPLGLEARLTLTPDPGNERTPVAENG